VKGVKNFSIKRKNNAWLKILVGVILLLVLLYGLSLVTSPVKNYFYVLSSPVQKVFWSAGESSSLFLGSLLNAGFLAKENQNLKDENQKLLSQVSSLQSINRGGQEFSQVSAACQNNGFTVVMAGVIGLEANDVLSLNKGSADGISEGMPVINEQSVLFGKVSKVYKNFSEVMLLSNKDSVVNVKIQQSPAPAPSDGTALVSANDTLQEIDGVIKGKSNLSAYLDLIPISSEINLNDVLVTSAVEKYFPKDLLVGKITQKQKNDQKPFQQAEINLFSDVSGLDNLFVITNYKKAD
jgi:rod shape-determining protein MreC